MGRRDLTLIVLCVVVSFAIGYAIGYQQGFFKCTDLGLKVLHYAGFDLEKMGIKEDAFANLIYQYQLRIGQLSYEQTINQTNN